MKKYLAILCASMMCVCCLVLAACGGGGSSTAASSAAASDSTSAAASSTAATSASAAASSTAVSSAAAVVTEADLVGDWKLAALEYQGIMMTGDLSVFFDEGMDLVMTLSADGTGSMTIGDETNDVTWSLQGSDITLSANGNDLGATYADGAISIAMADEQFSGEMFLTKDGAYANAEVISADDATNITSVDGLTGEWSLSAMSMFGVSMYGDAESLAAIAGDTSTTMALNADGTTTIFDTELPYSITAEGLVIGSEEIGGTMAVKKLGDDLIIDGTEVLGSPMLLVFSK